MTGFLPARRRRRAYFMLTPLVDVMFLLLIFFMLTSETGLYTLLRLSAPTVAAGDGTVAAPTPELLVSIGRAALRVNGTTTALSDLPAVLAGYKARNVASAVLVPTSGAEAQDIVAVLELFEAALFEQVRLVETPAVVP